MSQTPVYTPLPLLTDALLPIVRDYKAVDSVLDKCCAILADAYRWHLNERLGKQAHQDDILEKWNNALPHEQTNSTIKESMNGLDPIDLWDNAYWHMDMIQNPYEPMRSPGSICRGKHWLINGAINADRTGVLASVLSNYTHSTLQRDIQEPVFGSADFQTSRISEAYEYKQDGWFGAFPGLSRSLFSLHIDTAMTTTDELNIYYLVREYIRLVLNVTDTWVHFWDGQPDSTPSPHEISFSMMQARWAWEVSVRSPFTDIPIAVKDILGSMNYEGNFRFLCEHVIPNGTKKGAVGKEGLAWELYVWLCNSCIKRLRGVQWAENFLQIYLDMYQQITAHDPSDKEENDTKYWKPAWYRGADIDFSAYEDPIAAAPPPPVSNSNTQNPPDPEEDTDDAVHDSIEVIDPNLASDDTVDHSDDESLWEEFSLTGTDVELEVYGPPNKVSDYTRLLTDPAPDTTCPFCLETFKSGNELLFQSLVCSHAYHSSCLHTWINGVHKGKDWVVCPVCRENMCRTRPRRLVDP